MTPWIRQLALLATLSTIAATSLGGACNERTLPSSDGASSDPRAPAPSTLGAPDMDARTPFFDLTLSNGSPSSASSPAPTPPTQPLPPADATRLTQRLPPITTQPGDTTDFALRPATTPPPRTGDTLSAAFPPPPAVIPPPTVTATAPALIRFQPEGDVPLAPRVTLTFATPMVAVTSHTTLAAADLPATLAPAFPGTWRWVGTQTLLFDPTGRAPMATEFTVTIPKGTKDAAGKEISESKSFTFRTPPPSLVRSYPQGDSVNLTPTFYALFDQKIDADALRRLVQVQAAGKTYATRPLTADEEAKDAAEWREDTDQAGRWLAWKLTEPLPKATQVSVTFPANLPSAEGPRRTTAPQPTSFKTYNAFAVEEAECGWNGRCPPGTPLRIRFTNAIDEDAFDPSQVTVSPEVPGLRIEANYSALHLSGMTRGKTTYTVTLSPKLKDIFGQTLGTTPSIRWAVTESEPLLMAQFKPLTVLDPASKLKRLSAYVINTPNIEVQIYKVTPADWQTYLKALRTRWDSDDKRVPIPGQKVVDTSLPTQAPPEELTEVPIDLAPALTDGRGHAIVVLTPPPSKNPQRGRRGYITWVQATSIGLDAFIDHQQLTVWATDLATGAPLPEAVVTLQPSGTRATTDASGLATLPLPTGTVTEIHAQHRDDTALLPENTYSPGTGWAAITDAAEPRWLIFDDRHLYRPTETVSVKGFLRDYTPGARGDLALSRAKTIRWVATDSQDHELGQGQAPFSPSGAFSFTLKLPATPSLGTATITLTSDAGQDYHFYFGIQEFRRPDFEVTATTSEGPHIIGMDATATLSARYFAGGGLPNTPVHWQVTTSPTSYTPPNQDGFIFGTWRPWWRWDGDFGDSEGLSGASFDGRTDASGAHSLGLHFGGVYPPRPTSVNAEGTVQDVNRQTWSTTANFIVHPSKRYIGLRPSAWFTTAKKPLHIDAIVTQIDGTREAGVPATITAARMVWARQKDKTYKEVAEDTETCTLTSTLDAPARCTFAPTRGGRYLVTATVLDADGRPNQTTLSFWIPGGDRPADRSLEAEEATLIPSQKSYAAGDRAEILVQSPWPEASGTWVLSRGPIAEHQAFTVKDSAATLSIPIEEWMTPGVTLKVFLNGAADRNDDAGRADPNRPKRPAFATGSLDIAIPPVTRTLQVTATPAAPQTEPGAETSLAIEVLDSKGAPVANTELTVVVVDEAILALTAHTFPDPIAAFYQPVATQLESEPLRQFVTLAALGDLIAQSEQNSRDGNRGMAKREMSFSAGGGIDSAGKMMAPEAMPAPAAMAEMAAFAGKSTESDAAPAPIAVRQDMNPLVLFAPDLKTDAAGKVHVSLKMRDNLTRYKVVAISADGATRFGKGEAAITARLPLMVRLTPPRFLNFGDTFELPVVIQNQTDKALPVDVIVRAENAELTDGPGRRVTVPANDRVEVRFPARAVKPGTARFQAGVASGAWADATEVALPVWTPATTEAFATYGTTEGAAIAQPVQVPADAVLAFGGLEVQASSTQLQELTDALLYLTRYPYDCAEQVASRLLAIASLRDVLSAFKAKDLPDPAALKASVAADITRLQGIQGDDGGFGFWRRDEPSWPFVTVHVALALVAAQEKGFEIPEWVLARTLSYLQDIRGHMPTDRYDLATRQAIEAFALYVRHRAQKGDAVRAAALLQEAGGVDKANLELIGWLYPTFIAAKDTARLTAIRRLLNNRVTETAGAAHFVTRYGDGAYLLLHSDRRVDALLLSALIDDQPQNDLIPKLVRGLLGHRTAGRWQSTQENAWVLLALDHYFHTFEKTIPDFTFRAWLGSLFAGEHRFKGRTTERFSVDIPMAELAKLGTPATLTLGRQGAGRLYYRIGMRYAPKSLELAAADHGFYVERRYEAVDDPADVRQEADGHWVVRAGARVRVTLTMVADGRRTHVALVDPLPAGLEALNPELKGTQNAAQPPTGGGNDPTPIARAWRWWGPWYEHENLRDERVEAFASLLYAGVYTYSYEARATTPGRFIVPPAHAEEMYAPETFGRSASTVVEVRP